MPNLTQYEYDALMARQKRKPVNPGAPDPDAVEPGEENGKLRNAVIAECERRGWLVFSNRPDKRSTSTPGTPDLIIVTKMRGVLFVELKSRKGKLSDAQRLTQMRVEEKGYKVWIVRSLRAFLSNLAI